MGIGSNVDVERQEELNDEAEQNSEDTIEVSEDDAPTNS